jgi:hypothetical protein
MSIEAKRISALKCLPVLPIAIMLMCSAFGSPKPYPQDEETRDITIDWKSKRTEHHTGAASSHSGAHSSKPPSYVIKTKIPKAQDRTDSPGNSEVGISIWRLRHSNSSDEVRDLIQPSQQGPKEAWTAERVDSTGTLSDGQMVRLTIESLRTGYLYVIDRARYLDGTYGDPYLIFPTARINNGDNRVRAGRLIQIPDPHDKPSYLELHRGASKQGAKEDAEELMILVTPDRLDAIENQSDRVRLSSQMVDLLKQRYGAPVERSQMKGAGGAAITKAEDMAAKDPMKLLAADDPYPETIYRVAVGPSDPMLISVQLRVGD